MSESPIRILIVDDSALYRLLLRDVLNGIDGCEVVGVAENGKTALQAVQKCDPHLITLDVEMPDMNGIEVLQQLKRDQHPAKAIMVSRLTDAGAQTTTDALLEGAFDYIRKPSGGNPKSNKAELRQQLEDKISAFRSGTKRMTSSNEVSPLTDGEAGTSGKCDAVVIGCSTGGPEALRSICPKLQSNLAAPIIVVQHMPRQFTGLMALRLDALSKTKVVEAEHDMPVENGVVYIAPGGSHLKPVDSGQGCRFQLTDDPPVNRCRPSIDYTLEAACEVWRDRLLAVILTGMGHDGREGCRHLRQLGGRVLVQDANDCVVNGMPRAIVEAGIAHREISLTRLPQAISREIGGNA